jgi:hypothetical protein
VNPLPSGYAIQILEAGLPPFKTPIRQIIMPGETGCLACINNIVTLVQHQTVPGYTLSQPES